MSSFLRLGSLGIVALIMLCPLVGVGAESSSKVAPPGPLPAACDSWEAVQLLREGVVLQRSGQIERALYCYEKALTKDRGRLEILPYLVSALLVVERYDEAIQYADVYLRLEPSDYRMALMKAQALCADNNLVAASTLLNEWADKCSEEPVYYRLRGCVFLGLGSLSEAESDFRLAWQLEPSDVGVALDLAEVLCKQGRDAEALAILQDLPQDNPLVLNNLGTVLVKQKRDQEAQSLFQRASQMGDEVATVNAQCLAVYHGNSQLIEVAKLSDNYPDNAGAEALYAVMLYRSRRCPEALDIFLRLGSLQSESDELRDWARHYQGLCFLAMGQWPQAEAVLLPLVKSHPHDKQLRFNLSLAYRFLQKHSLAVQEAEMACQGGEVADEYWLNAAAACDSLGEIAKARHYYSLYLNTPTGAKNVAVTKRMQFLARKK